MPLTIRVPSPRRFLPKYFLRPTFSSTPQSTDNDPTLYEEEVYTKFANRRFAFCDVRNPCRSCKTLRNCSRERRFSQIHHKSREELIGSYSPVIHTARPLYAIRRLFLHIPTVVGHPFRFISDSHSNSKRTPVPIDIGQ